MINWLQGVMDSDENWHELVGEMIFGKTITLLHLLIIPANFLQVIHQYGASRARRFENGNSNIINTAGGIMLIIIHSG